jgi:murein DD-endopeptidase MepM/ murein hydrolase activator NlpD
MDLVNVLKDIITEQTNSPIVFPLPRFSAGLNNYGQNRGSYNHYAVDIPTSVGTYVYAPHNGTVTVAGIYDDGSYSTCGGTIIINSTHYRTTFCHMSGMAVSPGQWVMAGDLVGYSGGEVGTPGAGRTDGPHLHWKLEVDGRTVNPIKWVSPQRMPNN